MHKRVMALLLSLVLLLSAAMPVTAMAAEEYAGSFVLVAMNANSTIVEPTRIQYKSGKPFNRRWRIQILTLSGLENGFVYEINGVSANYLLYYDKGGYKLDAPASSVKALCFHVSSTYSDAATADYPNGGLPGHDQPCAELSGQQPMPNATGAGRACGRQLPTRQDHC